MKNITVTVDDDLYAKARVLAAERQTSVSSLVREHLQDLTALDVWEQRRQNLKKAFAAVDKAPRNHPKIGKFDRDEIYAERTKLR